MLLPRPGHINRHGNPITSFANSQEMSPLMPPPEMMMPLHQFADLIPSSHCHVIILRLLSVDAPRVLVGGFVVVSCITSSSTLGTYKETAAKKKEQCGCDGLRSRSYRAQLCVCFTWPLKYEEAFDGGQLHISRDNFVVLILYSSCRGKSYFNTIQRRHSQHPLKLLVLLLSPFCPIPRPCR